MQNYRNYIATREIPTCRGAGSALFTMCYVDAHAAIMESSCTELAMGHRRCLKGSDRASKWYSEKQRETVLGSETISLVSRHMTYNPPQADSPES